MTSVQQKYAELLALTKLYLLQEHAPTERIFADTDCFHYFREYAMRKTQPASTASPKATPRTTPQRPPLPTDNAATSAPTSLVQSPAQAEPLAPSTIAAAPPTPQPVALTPPSQLSAAQPDAEDKAPSISPANPPLPQSTPSSREDTAPPPAAFAPETPPPAVPTDLKEVWDLVKERLPGVELLAHQPNDTIAKEAARQWERKPAILEVAILSFEKEPKHKAFLDNISKALKIYGISAVVVNAARAEQEKAWPRLMEAPHVRLIISGGYGLYTLSSLMQYYVEGERSTGPKLGKIPLLMLSDAALYLKEPSLKPSLWKSLKEMLAIGA